MKKVEILAICLLLLSACSGNKDKKSSAEKKVDKTNVSMEDAAMKKWLYGKEWRPESEAAPIELMQTFSMDSCVYRYDKGLWNFKNGELTSGRNDLVSWPFVKLSDSSFTLYVAPTKRTFKYNFIKNL